MWSISYFLLEWLFTDRVKRSKTGSFFLSCSVKHLLVTLLFLVVIMSVGWYGTSAVHFWKVEACQNKQLFGILTWSISITIQVRATHHTQRHWNLISNIVMRISNKQQSVIPNDLCHCIFTFLSAISYVISAVVIKLSRAINIKLMNILMF